MQKRSQRPSRPSRMRQRSLCRSTDGSRLHRASGSTRRQAAWRRLIGELSSERRQKGDAMGEGRRVWLGTLCAAVIATGGLLAACSHDPIEPAPVYMMGADRATDRYAPVTLGSRPAVGQAGRRYPITPPASPAARTVRAQIAAHRHRGQSLYPFPRESPRGSSCNVACHSSTPGEGICNTASAMDGGASAMMIPLDDPAPERTPASSWVSPPPPERAPGEPAP